MLLLPSPRPAPLLSSPCRRCAPQPHDSSFLQLGKVYMLLEQHDAAVNTYIGKCANTTVRQHTQAGCCHHHRDQDQAALACCLPKKPRSSKHAAPCPDLPCPACRGSGAQPGECGGAAHAGPAVPALRRGHQGKQAFHSRVQLMPHITPHTHSTGAVVNTELFIHLILGNNSPYLHVQAFEYLGASLDQDPKDPRTILAAGSIIQASA